MQFRYAGRSGFAATSSGASLALATNGLREPVFFDGDLARPLVMRDGLAALRTVIASDFKWRPRDRAAFRAWLAEQDRKFVASLAMKSATARAELMDVDAQISELDGKRRARRSAFEKARNAYVAWAIADEVELSKVLDPVVTVHPDELSFEAFSLDQSSYARLAVRYDLFGEVRAFECGTTNIDFSAALADHLERLRSYRSTRFSIAPSGVGVTSAATKAEATSIVREKRIALPDGWLKGFLEVHALMSMGMTRVRLTPIDAYSLVRALLMRKAKTSPRAIRWVLVPGQPVKIVLEPWETELVCSPSTKFEGPKPLTIRTWGRDRLRTIARLLPVATAVDVWLAGEGLPTVWSVDLGEEARFTLALSGWTDNDWVQGEGRFDLLTRRAAVSAGELGAVHDALRAARKGTGESIAAATQIPLEKVRSALSVLCQCGRAMVDLAGGVHRHRDLTLEPFVPAKAVALAAKHEVESDPRAKEAEALFAAGEARIIARRPFSGGHKLSGNVKDGATRARPQITVDHEGQIVEATCTCAAAQKAGLTKGPCVHMLALRRAHRDRLEKEASA
jgi:hypothetical protein